MMSSESTMRSYYAARAPEYDAVYLKPERQADLRAIERWLPFIFTSCRVLEVACGTGYWTQFIAPVATHILAIDGALETLRIAKARLPEAKVELIVGDAYALPQRVDKFDAAFAGFWFSHVPRERQREFLVGLHAVLKPGAKVVLLDNRFVAGSSSPIDDRDSAGNTYQTRSLSSGAVHRVLKNFPTEDELRASIRGIGKSAAFTAWQYFWAFEYVVAQP